MLALLRRVKVRKYRLENLLLLETLVFLCIPSARVKDIMRLIVLGASPDGSLATLAPKMLRRIEANLLDSVPGALTAQAVVEGSFLELELAWPELMASLTITPRQGLLRADLELTGHGQDVMEMARDAQFL